MKYLSSIFLYILISSYSFNAYAEAGCEDIHLFSGRLLEDIYWQGVLPITILGVEVFHGNKKPPGSGSGGLCSCVEDGIARPGAVFSIWEPIRMIEHQRTPGCISSLGGIKMPFSDLFRGTTSEGKYDSNDKTFLSLNDFTAPWLYILEMGNAGAFRKGNEKTTFDLAFMSAIDPTFSNSTLASLVFPETLFMTALMPLCAEDAIQTSLSDWSNRFLPFCFGTWGMMGAPSNHHTGGASTIEEHNFLMVRYLAVLHRRGWLKESMGKDSYCEGKYQAFLPKTQYAFSTFNPVPEDDSWHVIGEPTIKFSSQRLIIGEQNTPVSVLWRRNDSCVY